MSKFHEDVEAGYKAGMAKALERMRTCQACGRSGDQREECTDERCMLLCDIRRTLLDDLRAAVAPCQACEMEWINDPRSVQMTHSCK